MLELLTQAFKLPDVRKRLLFTLGIIVIFRLLASIPIPGVSPTTLQEAQSQGGSAFFALFTLLTGGQVDNVSLVAIGLAPYITASIILQLLGTVIPKLEDLTKEGERGRQIINQWTRYITFPLALLQSIVIYTILKNPPIQIVPDLNGIYLVAFLLSLTAGTVLLMWLGELITESGVGNGASLIITLGILASLPGLLSQDIKSVPIDTIVLVLIGLMLMILIIVYVTEAVRKIPIQYARRVRGNKISGMQDSYLPLKITTAGVMPVIFAASLLTFPQIIAQFLLNIVNPATRIYPILESISTLSTQHRTLYESIYFVLIIAFTIFYTFVAFKPKDAADNLKKSGGFIPGIRPGKATQDHLTSVLMRLTIVGALFLAGVAIVPSFIRDSNLQLAVISGIGGTSILIVVSVMLDIYRQVQAMLVTRSYDIYS
ncbi:preprotein translocase subunit SecY [Candidatus Dojkabacteria bacterium]|uniref:Protein translocase subunit SecY n=1 Tax=Candidatus Dojkabacteria bacterium TaxID=2099670 RepID=A0A955RHP3_9BACT|nr:preprotein translocase subunit SecY [Candidatus Dojkabacteria bacterium]